jgi:DNA-binding response OmpR family regulator
MIKVVLVDDDTDLLEMVCLMLETPEISAICLDDCKVVIPALDAESPNVLVMDIFLGECDGRSLCKKVKSIKKYSALPILLYSAGQITEASITESGADDFISKPFEMPVLLNKIHKLANK